MTPTPICMLIYLSATLISVLFFRNAMSEMKDNNEPIDEIERSLWICFIPVFNAYISYIYMRTLIKKYLEMVRERRSLKRVKKNVMKMLDSLTNNIDL